MNLFGLFESRSGLESPTTPLTDTSLLSVLGGAPNDSGMSVSERTALKMSTVYRCTSLISSVAASLPLPTYRTGTRDQVASRLLDDPHPDMTPYELWRLTYAHRCLWGNAFLQKLRARSGQVQRLHPITPDRVQVRRVPVSDNNPTGKAFDVVDDWGKMQTLLPYELLHLPGLGYDGLVGLSPVKLAAQGIGLSMAAEKYGAKLFGSGNLLSGLLTTESRLEEVDARRLQARWAQKMSGLDRAHEVPVLDSGAKFQGMTMPNDTAQFLESRHFQVTDVTRYFGVPPFLLFETERSTSWGTGLEQQALGWVKFDLHPQWLAPTERRITKELTNNVTYAKYKVEGLLRGDSKARAEFYQTMRDVGAFSPNDIRELEDMPGLGPEGDTRLQPLNFVPLGTDPSHSADGAPSTEGDQ